MIAASERTLVGRVLPRAELGEDRILRMRELLTAHFEGVSEETFRRDLSEKNWAVLLEDEDGALRGFSTLLYYETSVAGGARLGVIYSGDTIVDRSCWGSPVLAETWVRAVQRIERFHRPPKLVWLLISSGYRTYRFLPVFWKEFHPRHDAPTPFAARETIDRLACERFGAGYLPDAGIVRLEHPQALRPELAEIPAGKLSDPHVAFFARRNPGHVRGDELVCLANLSPDNLTAAGRRVWRKAEER